MTSAATNSTSGFGTGSLVQAWDLELMHSSIADCPEATPQDSVRKHCAFASLTAATFIMRGPETDSCSKRFVVEYSTL